MDSCELAFPPDKGSELQRQVIGQVFQRLERGECRRQTGRDQLEDALGADQVLEAVLAEVTQLGASC